MSLELEIEKRLGVFRLWASFTAGEGVTGILGASGSGKSMALKCIAGIERPDRGRIVLDGTVLFDSEKGINLPPQRRQVGYLFQSYALFPNMTVRRNIRCGLREGKDRRARDERVEEALRLLRLEDVADRKPDKLSGGQAQRAALARILVNRPKLLMLDEPFSALDTHLRERLQLEVRELLGTMRTPVLLVTHSRDEAYRLCRNLTVVERGAYAPVRETKAVFADPGSVSAARVTGCKNIAPARRLDAYTLEVPDWKLRLRCETPLRENLCAVGLRAHDLRPAGAGEENAFRVDWCGAVEEPFERVLLFRVRGQNASTAPLWYRVPRQQVPSPLPTYLAVDSKSVLPLYP